MKCKCKAKPAPVVTWYRETAVVKESSKIKMKTIELGEDVYELILEIQVKKVFFIKNKKQFLRFFLFL